MTPLVISVCLVSTRNAMPDYGCEVIAEALAQRALVKPVYTFPIIPLSNSNQYRHQDHLDIKDYKKVRLCSVAHVLPITPATVLWVLNWNVCATIQKLLDICPSPESILTITAGERNCIIHYSFISYCTLVQIRP